MALDDTCGDTRMGIYFSKGAGEALRTAGALSTVGLAFVLALVIGFWFGTVVDRWVGTKPAFTIVFFFFGLAAGILNVFRIVSQAYPKQGPGTTAQASGTSLAPPAAASKHSDGPDDRELHDDSP
jgi:ATP synthase protein I